MRNCLMVLCAVLSASCAATPPSEPKPVAALTGATSPAASGTASLPFKTLAADDPGTGRFLKAGTSETVVLHSKADLDAFLARHPQAVTPVTAPPAPNASPTPPSGIPYGTQPPAFQPAPIPASLNNLDFDKDEAIAFFDGAVPVASTSRIVAVQEQADGWVVRTERWVPPPNPAAIPDVNGRLHVIAIARSDKPVTFPPPDVVDGSAAPDQGGIGVGGNPLMHPMWPAVPNPDVTHDSVEAMVRGLSRDSTVTSFQLSLEPLSTALDSGSRPVGSSTPNPTNFTPDSLVWVAKLEGKLSLPMGGGMGGPGVIGASEPYSPRATVVVSPEDGRILTMASEEPTVENRGMRFRLLPDGDLHYGDTLHFDVTGTPPDGTMTMTLSSGSAAPFVKQIAYKDLATFSLPIDSAHLPLLTGAPLQPISIKLQYGNATESRDVHVVRDPNARPQPPMRVYEVLGTFPPSSCRPWNRPRTSTR